MSTSKCSPSSKKAWRSPGSNRIPTANRTDQSQPLYRLSQILILVLFLALRLYNFEFVFTVVKSTMPSYQKLQWRLTAPYILVACDGGLQRKKINTDVHVSMCNCSGGTELDKAVKFRISRSAWCTFSRVEQIRGYVPRENEHQGAHFRGWCTNSLANCRGFVPQWLERPIGNRKTRVRSPAGLRCVFRLIQLSVHICRIEKERSLIRWNGPDRNEFSIWTIIFKSNEFRWSLRVCRLKHSGHLVVKKNWQFGERQKFARSSCRGFVAQWLERPIGNRKTRVRSPAGAALCFSSDPAVSSHLSDIKRKKFD